MFIQTRYSSFSSHKTDRAWFRNTIHNALFEKQGDRQHDSDRDGHWINSRYSIYLMRCINDLHSDIN